MPPRTALLVGATGLVGRHCLTCLLAEPAYGTVHVLARRALPVADDRLHARTVEFDAISPADVPAVDDVYCCLGTTIAVAGSQEVMHRIDHGYTLTVARLARQAGARRLALVSSIGADASSRTFYLRLKGEIERDLATLGYDTLELFRPGPLLGHREPPRPRDKVADVVTRAVAPVMIGGLRGLRPVRGAAVADAMVAAVLAGEPGVRVRRFDDIAALNDH